MKIEHEPFSSDTRAELEEMMDNFNFFQNLSNSPVSFKLAPFSKQHELIVDTQKGKIELVLTFQQIKDLRGAIEITEQELNDMYRIHLEEEDMNFDGHGKPCEGK